MNYSHEKPFVFFKLLKISSFLVIKLLLLIFLYFALFHRNIVDYVGISGGTLAVLSGTILFIICLCLLIIRKRFFLSTSLIITLFYFSVSFLLPLISALLLGISPHLAFRFSMEVLLGFFMFYSVYYLIQIEIITPKFMVSSIAYLGLISTAVIIISFFDPTEAIRRLGALGGQNYIANSLTVSTVAWMIILFQSNNEKKIYETIIGFIVIVLILLVVFLLGSRQAIIAFSLCAFLFNFMMLDRTKSILNATIFISFIVLVVVALSSVVDLTGLYSRFEVQTLKDASALRLQMYYEAIYDLSILDILIGRPDYYEVWATQNSVHPHNLFLSTLRYTGILSLVSYVILILILTFKWIKVDRIFEMPKQIKLYNLAALLFFLAPFVYSMFSGNMTRIYSLYIFLGFLIGTLDLKNRDLKNYLCKAKIT